MPLNMVDGVPYDAEGNPIPHRVTRMEIGQGEEKIVLEDEAGIDTGSQFGEIFSMLRIRNFFRNIFPGKER